jgi:hypothetical protein
MLFSNGQASSMVTAIENGLFLLYFSRIKELPVLIAGRGEIGAFARSLNDTERADMPLLLSWSSLKAWLRCALIY